MIEGDQNEHVIDWEIEKFSCCPQTTGIKISTGQFRSQILGNTYWQIHLYPRGIEDANYISCFLERTDDSNECPAEIPVSCEFSLLTFNGFQCEKTVKTGEYCFRKVTSFGFKYFMKRCDVFKDKETYLLKDMLKLRCRMRKCIPRIEQKFINLRTKVDPHISSIQIPIQILDGESSKTVFPVSTKKVEDLLTLTVYVEKDHVSDSRGKKRADSSVHIIITKTKTLAPIYVSCYVKVIDTVDWNFPLEHTAAHAFEEKRVGETWDFPSFIKISKLYKSMIQNHTINLDFNIKVCGDDFQTYLEDLTPSKLTRTGNDRTLKNDFVTLCKTGLYSDAKLKIGDECFPVHKSILSIRSSVFKKLFEEHARTESAADVNDPKDDQECVLELTDVDKDNLRCMLDFVYADVFDFKGFASCLSLYASAHKYDIPSLKEKCFDFLVRHMTVKESFTTFHLAHELNDGKLKFLALNTIKKNREYALLTDEWMQFAEEEPELMSQVLHHIRFDRN